VPSEYFRPCDCTCLPALPLPLGSDNVELRPVKNLSHSSQYRRPLASLLWKSPLIDRCDGPQHRPFRMTQAMGPSIACSIPVSRAVAPMFPLQRNLPQRCPMGVRMVGLSGSMDANSHPKNPRFKFIKKLNCWILEYIDARLDNDPIHTCFALPINPPPQLTLGWIFSSHLQPLVHFSFPRWHVTPPSKSNHGD
jgi:hypothetical protein